MVEFVPMTEAEFAKWRELAITEYASDRVRAGNDDAAHSVQNAAKEFHVLLPYGAITPGHYICSVVDEREGKAVGLIWYGEDQHRKDTLFIYDIQMDELFRGKGHGTAALKLLEKKAEELGKKRIGLQVFGHNERAQKLYRELGYKPTNIFMVKEL